MFFFLQIGQWSSETGFKSDGDNDTLPENGTVTGKVYIVTSIEVTLENMYVPNVRNRFLPIAVCCPMHQWLIVSPEMDISGTRSASDD